MENCIVCGRDIGEHKPRFRAAVMSKDGIADRHMCRPCTERVNKMT